jgi:hypothetical protein
LKKSILSLVVSTVVLLSCKKESLDVPVDLQNIPPPIVSKDPCISQTGNPGGRSYDADSLLYFIATDRHCGMLPLSTKNYWVYQDSVFLDGIFQQVKTDTLRFSSNIRSLADGLTWWQSKVNVGIPQLLYTNDTTLYALQPKLYNPDYMDAKKDLFLFPGDSVKYLSGFDDIAAAGRSLRINGNMEVPAGSFENYIYFEKNARSYRKDQVYFKPGVGVLKYIHEQAPMGQRVIKMQHIKTLIAFHIE